MPPPPPQKKKKKKKGTKDAETQDFNFANMVVQGNEISGTFNKAL